MKKKIIIATIGTAILLSACGNNNSEIIKQQSSATTAAATEMSADSNSSASENSGDLGFNNSGAVSSEKSSTITGISTTGDLTTFSIAELGIKISFDSTRYTVIPSTGSTVYTWNMTANGATETPMVVSVNKLSSISVDEAKQAIIAQGYDEKYINIQTDKNNDIYGEYNSDPSVLPIDQNYFVVPASKNGYMLSVKMPYTEDMNGAKTVSAASISFINTISNSITIPTRWIPVDLASYTKDMDNKYSNGKIAQNEASEAVDASTELSTSETKSSTNTIKKASEDNSDADSTAESLLHD